MRVYVCVSVFLFKSMSMTKCIRGCQGVAGSPTFFWISMAHILRLDGIYNFACVFLLMFKSKVKFLFVVQCEYLCVCVLFTQWERWISSGDLVENPLYSPSQLESHKLKSLLLFHAGGFSALVMSRTNTTTIWECWGFGTYSYLRECVRVEWSVLTCWRF